MCSFSAFFCINYFLTSYPDLGGECIIAAFIGNEVLFFLPLVSISTGVSTEMTIFVTHYKSIFVAK